MSHTRTGQFGIGFRRSWSPWQKDLEQLLAWTKDNGFECLDVRGADAVSQVASAGLAIGSADLPDFKAIITPDRTRRDEAVAEAIQLIRDCAGKTKNFFTVMLPEDPALPRKENFSHMVEAYSQLTGVLQECGARVVIEGWPGPGALCCTPETVRALFAEIPSPTIALNYDPSHLLRMGMDPLRFLGEFADHVGHVHGKDTELLSERLYELGCEQPATFAESIGWGGNQWRYTIPGHGQMRWSKGFAMLVEAGYEGMVSIELEDANFNGAETTEKQGLLQSKAYLESC